MKPHHHRHWAATLLGAAFITALPAQTTEFTYQGQLKQNGIPTAGLYDLRFELFDAQSGGNSLGVAAKPAVPVSGGMFTVAIDFGTAISDGPARWLEIGVRLTGDAGYAPVTPRSKVTPAPLALHADRITGGAPVGVIIDWWRASPSTPVPEGYHVCDGSMVFTPENPYGLSLPDLRGKFVMGSSDGTTVGETGGSASHTHTVDINHDHPAQATSNNGTHTHSVDPPLYGGGSILLPTSSVGDHAHAWIRFSGLSYQSWRYDGSTATMISYTNGIDNEGTGTYPLCDNNGTSGRSWYTSSAGAHQHQYSVAHDHPAFTSGSVTGHSHVADLPSLGSLNKGFHADHLPPYYGLLKIMRIK